MTHLFFNNEVLRFVFFLAILKSDKSETGIRKCNLIRCTRFRFHHSSHWQTSASYFPVGIYPLLTFSPPEPSTNFDHVVLVFHYCSFLIGLFAAMTLTFQNAQLSHIALFVSRLFDLGIFDGDLHFCLLEIHYLRFQSYLGYRDIFFRKRDLCYQSHYDLSGSNFPLFYHWILIDCCSSHCRDPGLFFVQIVPA